jgi:carnosine N-methyltransferase
MLAAVRANGEFCQRVAREDNSYHRSFGTTMKERTSSVGRSVAQSIQSEDTLPIRPTWTESSSAANMSKVVSALWQLAREWSSDGEDQRAQCLDPMLAELLRIRPVTQANRNKQRVLAPGCGAGRIVLELAIRGYAAVGNEFCYGMLLVATFMLNRSTRRNEFTIHPWVTKRGNHFTDSAASRAVQIPDLCAREALSTAAESTGDGDGPSLSMCAGEFLVEFSKPEHVGQWAAVLTCFFIDTAPNILDYIDCIWRLLEPGGVWINNGPLLYHWAAEAGSSDDPRYEQSVELSYEAVRHVAEGVGFIFEQEARCDCRYAADPTSMMATAYNTVLFSARKPKS